MLGAAPANATGVVSTMAGVRPCQDLYRDMRLSQQLSRCQAYCGGYNVNRAFLQSEESVSGTQELWRAIRMAAVRFDRPNE